MGKKLIYIISVVVLFLTSCSTTKLVPENQYLLNKTKVEVLDTKQVQGDDLKKYLRQKQNTEILGFLKLQLKVWNAQGKDSTKWINRQIRKIGEAPEIFSEQLTEQSMIQLKKAMDNKGYFLAQVDTTLRLKKKKAYLTYLVKANEPYTLRHYDINIQQPDLLRYATRRSNISKGMLFDTDVLDEERLRIANLMRYTGYYYFEKDYLNYIADSAYNTNDVDLRLQLQDYITQADDSIVKKIFTQFTISEIVFYTTSGINTESQETLTHQRKDNYSFIYPDNKPFIRNRTLIKACPIKPGDRYNLRQVERAYSALNSLSPVKYVNIEFEQIDDDKLRCFITISKAKVHTFTADVEGTFSAGDWGIGAGAGYTNRNIFKGAEEFSINASSSYEWRHQGGRAIEFKAEAGLKFPSNVKVGVGYSFQQRPSEFNRTIANANLTYSYKRVRSLFNHNFTLLDISYVYLPWISQAFSDYFLQSSNILKYSYEDHFIMDWAYNGSYSSYSSRQPLRNYVTVNYGAETAGNLLYGVSKIFDLPKNDDGAYKIFKIPFAQYVKFDANITYHQIFNKQHRLVYHAALGVAVPFGNVSSIPFEKRYFAGGANSVRGWAVRTLGPGSYRGTGQRIDFNNQAGDIKLDLNLEYRVKVISFFELAAFTDAGNIWTFRNYNTQPHGQISKDFYKELGWSYGVGVRLNFDFFVFRVDFGVKLYDPSRINYDQKQWRTAPNGLGWKDDMSLHFAIGYPF